MQKLRGLCLGQEEFPQQIIDWIEQNSLWNLWVPKAYGGLELSLPEGLKKLRSLAQIDGSLGWTVTLCSRANFFIGNLEGKVANEIFGTRKDRYAFGGSGVVGLPINLGMAIPSQERGNMPLGHRTCPTLP